MTRREELEALAARVEALMGPCRETDAMIWLATETGATREQWSYIHEATGRECFVDETRNADRRLIIVPAFTASLDSAMALADGREWTVQSNKPKPMAIVAGIERYVVATTPALALTAAALRAIAALGAS